MTDSDAPDAEPTRWIVRGSLLAALAVAVAMTAAVAAATTRHEPAHRTTALVFALGGPRLPGPLGRLELRSAAARIVVWGDEMIGPGAFHGSTLATLLRDRSTFLLGCYESQLATAPALTGRIELRATMGTWGGISDVSVTGHTTDFESVQSCTSRIVDGIRASPGPVGGPVTFPLRMEFEPRT